MRFVFTISYTGHAYSGFQEQPQKATVQSELEKAFARVLGEEAKVISSGRTDAGVHALEQVCHINLNTEKSAQRIQKSDFLLKINAVLPDDIAIRSLKKPTKEFHARAQAKKKAYVYVILIAIHKNPFLEKNVWRIPQKLNLAKMQAAAKFLIGKHDFSAFCASDSTATDKVRDLFAIKFSQRSPFPLMTLKDDQFLTIQFEGKGFLKQMVRNIVGTLVAIGIEKIPPESLEQILKSKDRKKAAVNAPAKGLYLKKVFY